jgi:hypothetical protein
MLVKRGLKFPNNINLKKFENKKFRKILELKSKYKLRELDETKI